MREYRDEVTDLAVKTAGGMLTITRHYRSGSWQWEGLTPLVDGRLDDTTPYKSSTYGPDYVTRGGCAL